MISFWFLLSSVGGGDGRPVFYTKCLHCPARDLQPAAAPGLNFQPFQGAPPIWMNSSNWRNSSKSWHRTARWYACKSHSTWWLELLACACTPKGRCDIPPNKDIHPPIQSIHKPHMNIVVLKFNLLSLSWTSLLLLCTSTAKFAIYLL